MAPNMSWLKADLQEYCNQAGTSYRAKDTKQDLLDLIQAASGGGSNERRSSSSNATNHQHRAADKNRPGGQPNMDWLQVDLQAYCNSHNISYASRDTKQQLLDLIESHGRHPSNAKPVRRPSSSSDSSSVSEPRSIPTNKQPSLQWLKAELQAYCEEHHINFKARDTKQQLLDFIRGAQESPASRRSSTGSEGSVSIGSARSSSSGCACSAVPAAGSGGAQGRKKTSKSASESARWVQCVKLLQVHAVLAQLQNGAPGPL